MSMVKTDKLVFEYEKRDEEGNVIGKQRAIDYRILQRSFLPLAPSDVHTILLNQFSLMCGTHTRQLSHFSIIAFTFR